MAHSQPAALGLLACLLAFAALAVCASVCVPDEPYLDCSFYKLSSPKWPELSSRAESLVAAWKGAVAQTAPYPADHFVGRGLVVTATALDLVNVPVLLDVLQSQGANLPVEIWYTGEMDSKAMYTLFSAYTNVVIKNLANYASPHDLWSTVTGEGERIFQAKPIAALNSAFEEVLFLDADNIPLSDVSALFASPEYLSTGALFWPDFWQSATHNPVWSILGVSPGGWEQESGQFVVNKRRAWGALNLAVFLAKTRAFQGIVNGDKEAFRLAFLATGTPFHMVGTPVAAAGVAMGASGFCGHTMVQHDTTGAPLFLHHNSVKHGAAIAWDVLKSVPAGKSFSVEPLPPVTINGEPVSCLDLTGTDVITTRAPFVDFAKMFAQLQSSTHPELKTMADDEFISATQQMKRRLLQGNGTAVTAQPVNGACFASNPNPCYSRKGFSFVCCSTSCSQQYANPAPDFESVQFCSGDLNPQPAPTPSPTPTPAISIPADANNMCPNPLEAGQQYTTCASRFGGLRAVCCLTVAGGCSQTYANPDPYVDSPQTCLTNGGTVSSGPTGSGGSGGSVGGSSLGVAPSADGTCSADGFRSPCYPAGASRPAICCAEAGAQCTGTDTATPTCVSL